MAFEKDSLELALNGNGLSIGFLDIIDEYGSTKAANLANYYTGLCYLNLGQPADAIGYLDNFKGSDPVLSILAKGAIGDAFANLNQDLLTVSLLPRMLNSFRHREPCAHSWVLCTTAYLLMWSHSWRMLVGLQRADLR